MVIRPNRVKDQLRQGRHALCFAAWGYSGADHLERLAPAQPDGHRRGVVGWQRRQSRG